MGTHAWSAIIEAAPLELNDLDDGMRRRQPRSVGAIDVTELNGLLSP